MLLRLMQLAILLAFLSPVIWGDKCESRHYDDLKPGR